MSVQTEQIECSACESTKPPSDFGPDRRTRTGRASKCRNCAAGVRRAYYAKYPEAEAKRRLTQNEISSRWYQQNRDRLIPKFSAEHLRRRYGLSLEAYSAMLAAQSNCCAICKATTPGRGNKRFLVDHDHGTGVVRGLLCHSCNVGLGAFKDSVEFLAHAMAYLGGRK